MEFISEEELIGRFDQLVSEGVIVYGPHTKYETHDGGYPIEFRICPALATKPHTVGATNLAVSSNSRRWGPGSDMFCPDERLILAQLNNTHDLALNLFCVDRPQLLILTLDSYKRQHEPLDQDDFKAALEVLRRWTGWYVIFNCGERAGCSRVHKHLQGLRGPPHAFNVLQNANGGESKVPFKFFMHRFPQGFKAENVSTIWNVYNEMLIQCRSALDEEVCPHNVVLWDSCIVVIPRSKGMWEGASANTGGMLGSIWVQDQAEVDKWLKAGCANVLRELGVPS